MNLKNVLEIMVVTKLQEFCYCELFYPQKYGKKPFGFSQGFKADNRIVKR